MNVNQNLCTMDELGEILGFKLGSDFIATLGIEITKVGPARCVMKDDVPKICRLIGLQLQLTAERISKRHNA